MLRIHLTGEPCLWDGTRLARAADLPGRQGRIAFAYLVSERARPVRRDELCDVLWPARVPDASEVALSALISKLRAVLAAFGLTRRALTAADGCYLVSLPSDVWVDTEVAVESAHVAEERLRKGDAAAAYGPAVVAAAILRRPFLPAVDGDWVEGRRRTLHGASLRAHAVLADVHAQNNETALAVQAAEVIVSLEPFRESGYRLLMRIHRDAGDRAEALRVYERCRRVLAAELGTRPSPETEAARAGVLP